MSYYKPDEEEVLFSNMEKRIKNPHDTMRMGICMVYQHIVTMKLWDSDHG